MSIENGERPGGSNSFQLKWAIAGAVLAAYLIARDHWAHVVDYLPYLPYLLIILACPLVHLFMHRGGGHSGHHQPSNKDPRNTNS